MQPLKRPEAEKPFKHVIAEYRHSAQTITCECGWHGSSATKASGVSEWRDHLVAVGAKPR